MPRIISNHLGKFLIALFLILVFAAGFLFFKNFSARAQEEIKILPESFSGDWQNPKAVFTNDLGSTATFEEFNKENSAYPLEITEEIPETGFWMKLKNLFNPEAQAETSICKSGSNQPCGTEIGVCQIGVQICQNGVWGQCLGAVMPSQEICDGVDNDCDGQVDEGVCAPETCQNGSNRPCGNNIGACQIGVQICENGVWGKCIGAKMPTKEICDEVDNDCDGQIDEGAVCGGVGGATTSQIEKTLTLSGFGISPPQNTKIKLAQLRLSLAGKGEAGDKLVVDYFYQDVWHNLAIFNLENEISNVLNGGYFLFGLPIFENWEDLDNLKIRFTYLSENSSPTNSLVYLDAVWLEVETEESTGVAPLQISEGEKFILKSIKKDWQSGESPEFEIAEAPQSFWGKITSLFQKKEKLVVLIDPSGGESSEGVIIQGDKIKISQPKERGFKPGLYKLKITIIEGGEQFIQEQDFTWGVLAINTSKSIYLPNETAYLQMAALKDDGHTLCNADLKLEITPPVGEQFSATVERSGKCGANNVTDVPDYFAYYQVEGAGKYQMVLTNFDNGYQITDFFEVREAVPFDVERIGPTRIYPPASYPVTFSIISNQDFEGVIEERVPASFEIFQPVYSKKYNSISEEGDTKLIRWEVSLVTGERMQLGYYFNAPDISPYLYLLGPLKIGDFQEIRQWQIASDAINEVFLFWDGSADAPTGWTCVSCSEGGPYYQYFPMGTSTVPSAASTTHSHTISLVSYSAPSATLYYDDPGTISYPSATHTHPSISGPPSMNATTAVAAYYELKVIKAASPSTIPAGAIAIFDTSNLPANWATYTEAVGNQIIRGGPNASTTGSSHIHSEVSFTVDNAADSVTAKAASTKAGELVAHSHSVSGGSTDASDQLPPYIGVILAKTTAEVNLSDSSGMIAMFDNASLPTNWAAVNAINDNRFLKATSTSGSEGYGATGGSTTHGHPNKAFTSGITSNTVTDADNAPADVGADDDHTHDITVSFPTADNRPPYRGTIFAKYTYIPPANATPSFSSLQFHNGVAITLPEWSLGAGTYNASTTFRVTDTDGYAQINTTTVYVYRSGVSGVPACTGDINNCYQPANKWTQDSAGTVCARTATGVDWADFWCTTTLYYVAEATDAANSGYDYSAQTWTVYASTSDINWAQATSTASVEINTTQALAIDSTSITYPTLGAGTNSTSNWATTTATTTGNVAIDIHFYGTTMTGPGDAIAVGQQKLTTTTPATYGTGDFALLASPGKTHDLTMAKATTTSPGPTTADKVFWGIAIPSLQAAGSYTGTNTLTATSTIVNP